MIDEETYKKGGYKEAGVSPKAFRNIKSRAIGSDGKVYQGEAGIRLQEKRSAEQEFYMRNR